MMFPLNPTTRRDDRLTDDEFYAFCQANPSLRLERAADGQIIFDVLPGFGVRLSDVE